MRAWTVTLAHIDALVLAGVQFGVGWDGTEPAPGDRVLRPAGLAVVGAALWRENHRSVDHLYGEHTEPPAYSSPAAEVVLDPVGVVKAVDCYVYQSCEHPGWPASRAADYCRRLRRAALAGLPLEPGQPGQRPYPAGWVVAPWGIDTLAQIAAGSRPAVGATGGAP